MIDQLLTRRNQAKAALENAEAAQNAPTLARAELAALEAELQAATERERLRVAEAERKRKVAEKAHAHACKALVELDRALEALTAAQVDPPIGAIPGTLFLHVKAAMALYRQYDPAAIGLPPPPTQAELANREKATSDKRRAELIENLKRLAKQPGELGQDARRRLRGYGVEV